MGAGVFRKLDFTSMRSFLRSIPARLALIASTVFLTVSSISRLLLLINARHELDWNPSLAGALATGVFFDAASAVFAGVPWILLGSVVPARFLKSRGGSWTMTALFAVFVALLIFITTAEWIFSAPASISSPWTTSYGPRRFLATSWNLTRSSRFSQASLLPPAPLHGALRGQDSCSGLCGVTRAGIIAPHGPPSVLPSPQLLLPA